MAEPYELSQDLLDKQMEVLSSRYGGISQANDAANTIQRAYRRYSMVKKFAAITSAVQKNTEHRLSRRYQGQQQQQQHVPGAMLGHTQAGQPGTGAPQLQHRVRHVNSEEEAHRRQAWSGWFPIFLPLADQTLDQMFDRPPYHSSHVVLGNCRHH